MALFLSGAVISVIMTPAVFADSSTVEAANTTGPALAGCDSINGCFVPHTVIIDVGGEVKWTNNDVAPHTVTSGVLIEGGPDGKFESGTLLTGAEFTHVFEEAGVYPYLCLIHTWMTGQVIVQEAVEDGSETDLIMVDVEDRFITTWEIMHSGDFIIIPVGGATGSYIVDWGDGVVTMHEGDAMHVYDAPGTYTVQVSGDFTRISLGDDPVSASMLRSIDQWGAIQWTSMKSAFEGASNMVYNATDIPDLSRVTDMSSMFANARSFNGDISDWNVSSVTDMSSLFWFARSFNQNIGSWDVSSVQDMSRMFDDAASYNQPLNSWDVSAVQDMSGMFSRALLFNQDLDSWDVSSVQDMSGMFSLSRFFNGNISTWDVSSVQDMAFMFSVDNTFNQPLDNWDVSSVQDMSYMFSLALSFNHKIFNWDVSSVQDMAFMFSVARSFNQPLNSWNTSSVTTTEAMFFVAISFNQDLDSWDVSSVQDMTNMFTDAVSFNGNISTWDVSSVESFNQMFADAVSFNQPLDNWMPSSAKDMALMFWTAHAFNQPLNSWDVSSVQDMTYMLRFNYDLDQNLGNWYIVLGDTSVDSGDTLITTITAQNSFLDWQNPKYSVAPDGDGDLFFMDGNILRSISGEYTKPHYNITIVATDGFVMHSFRDVTITVIQPQ